MLIQLDRTCISAKMPCPKITGWGVCVCVCVLTQWCLTLCDTMDCSLPGSSVHGIFPAKVLEWVVSSWPQDGTLVSSISLQLDEPVLSTTQFALLTGWCWRSNVLSRSVLSDSETPGTSARQVPLSMGILQGRNTGVGCHALLQGIFPTQGSNTGLPHCRWILYHLSHQRSQTGPELQF